MSAPKTTPPWFRFNVFGLLALITFASVVLAGLVIPIRIRELTSDDAIQLIVLWCINWLPEGVVAFGGLCLACGSCRLKPGARRLAITGFSGIILLVLSVAILDLSTTDEVYIGVIPDWAYQLYQFIPSFLSLMWALVVIALFYGRDDHAKQPAAAANPPA